VVVVGALHIEVVVVEAMVVEVEVGLLEPSDRFEPSDLLEAEVQLQLQPVLVLGQEPQ
jgi:hypothetical protein